MNGLPECSSKVGAVGMIFEHRMVAIPGMRLRCVLGGTGPVIVLVAGFPQSCYAWRRVMPLLAPQFRVIAVDLPGQGGTDKP